MADQEEGCFCTKQAIFNFVKVMAMTLYYIITASIKAILPSGILPKKSVKGQNVLITGGGSGIGRLMAQEFAKLGVANVVIWDVNTKGANETVDLLKSTEAKGHAHTVDISKKEAIYEAAAKVKKEIGPIDILINNAGIVTGKKLFECDDDMMELTMAVNTTSHFFTTKTFLPHMLESNRGHIVTIASLAGKSGITGLVDYCASKFGAVGFSESLGDEIRSLKKDGVHVTTVCPYYIDTGMFTGVKTFSPNLLPILEPNYVVSKIVEAVLTDAEYLMLPRFGYISVALSGFLPTKAARLLAEYFGINKTMSAFTGRKKED
uniref:Estradiol 17-beta-dehydrogenase 11 n=1 Tax=Rhabditophanes sp. KR3021 TaxID=114890 RepID=A0AC35TU39_9BILA